MCFMSKVYSIITVQEIPATIDKVWDFFSNPGNLQAITPDDLDFRIISNNQREGIYAGQVIEYKVKPVWNIPVYWMTEITQVNDKHFFIDEQRVGPYALWHHQHHFREISNGVEMTDIVHYKIPFWFLGDLANKLFIKRKLGKIFEYRRQKVEEKFGKV